MNPGPVIFNNNEGIGGFEQGLYDNNAIQPTDNNWTRQSCFSLPERPRLLWKISRKNAYFISTCAVGKNKTIIVPECDGKLFSEEGRLIEIDEHGTIKELFRCKSKLHRPIIGMDGLLYITTFGAVNSKGNRLFCLFPDGTVKWEFLINDCANSSPVIDGEGNIYIFTYGDKIGTLFSISKDGTLNWNYKFPSVNW